MVIELFAFGQESFLYELMKNANSLLTTGYFFGVKPRCALFLIL